MAKEIYCPECETEYWGSIQNAKCGECEHKKKKGAVKPPLDS